MAGTILRLGWSDPRTGTFGAHPQLGAVLDLNDGQTYTLLAPDGLEMPSPPRTLALAGNARTSGERGIRALYRQNRRVRLSLALGPMASSADLIASLRLLHAWLQAPPALPVALEYQASGAAAPVYLDVVGAAWSLPADEAAWLRLQFEPLIVELVARPGLRGDRLTLSNLVANPGFEQGSGPAVPVFDDPLTTFSAYTVTGGSPGRDIAASYSDVVLGDSPLRYYRLDESGGTSAYDATGSGQNGTYSGGYTQSEPGALAGDSDAAVLFNGSTGCITCPATGLPTGTVAVSIECWVNLSATPTGTVIPLALGKGGTNGQEFYLAFPSSTAIWAGSGTVNSQGPALALNTWHHLVATYDGANIRLYSDGALVAGPTAASVSLSYGGASGLSVAQLGNTTDYFSGLVDEVAVYATALTPTQVSNHYTAGHTPPATIGGSMTLPAGALATFGDAHWSSINSLTCQVRIPTSASTTLGVYLHRVDTNNWLVALVTGGTTDGSGTLALIQTIAGTQHTLASASGLDPNVRYALTLSQFPTQAGVAAWISATLTATGATTVTCAGATADTGTAFSGQPAFQATGGAIAITGPVVVSEFGPGGYRFSSTGSNIAYGHWEQTVGNTYPSGPIASFGAARIDLNASGGPCDATWNIYAGSTQSTPQSSMALPVRAAGDQISISAWVKTSGLSSTSTVRVSITEYDSGGNALRTDTGWTAPGQPSAAGNTLTTWTQQSGAYTTGANCAYLDIALRVSETTSGGSANGTIWWDNLQAWNVSAAPAAQTSMPYCELRFPQSPAQIIVSGIQGDLPAPALVECGTSLASWPLGGSLTLALGRRAAASWGAQLVGQSYGYYGPSAPAPVIPALDSASYGGFSLSTQVTSGGWNPRAFSGTAADLAGTYHLWARALTRQAMANLGNVQTRAVTTQQGSPWFGASNGSDLYGTYYGPYAQPFSASSAWMLADAGPVTLPPFRQGAMADPTINALVPRTQWVDSTSGGSTCEANWQCLLPVDGALLLATLNNPTNAPFVVTGQWLWAYVDGLLVNRASAQDAPSSAYSLEATAQPNPAHAGGGTGNQGSGAININLGADLYLTLDPTLALSTPSGAIVQGINQLVGVVLDGAGAVLPLALELQYTPLYLVCR